ncbi:MAG: hypothetical protein K9M44_01475 [Candidatus Pacebacteria bacterium]|nr:hypothetical protein [Candidatus Paceibacterota bacterium]
MKEKILQTINQSLNFSALNKDWQNTINLKLEKIKSSSLWQEISLQAWLLDDKQILNLQENLYLSLGNIYIWLAYTLYDQVLDNQQIHHLPLANFLLSQSLKNYYSVNLSLTWQNILEKVILKMETANYWEIENCQKIKEFHSPKIPALSDHLNSSRYKSLAHCLPAIYLLLKYQSSSREEEINEIIALFSSLLLVRQIQDDLHDLEVDFSNRSLNLAIHFCLETSSKEIKSIKELKIQLYLTQTEIIKRLKQENKNCQILLRANSVFKNNLYLNKAINSQSEQIKIAQKKQETVKTILNYFKV